MEILVHVAGVALFLLLFVDFHRYRFYVHALLRAAYRPRESCLGRVGGQFRQVNAFGFLNPIFEVFHALFICVEEFFYMLRSFS